MDQEGAKDIIDKNNANRSELKQCRFQSVAMKLASNRAILVRNPRNKTLEIHGGVKVDLLTLVKM